MGLMADDTLVLLSIYRYLTGAMINIDNLKGDYSLIEGAKKEIQWAISNINAHVGVILNDKRLT